MNTWKLCSRVAFLGLMVSALAVFPSISWAGGATHANLPPLFNEIEEYQVPPGKPLERVVIDLPAPPAVTPSGPRMAILLLSDGARQDLIEKFVREGRMPNVKRLFFDQGWVVENAVTIWPSSSIPSHTSITTASLPDRHGILGQRWFEPEKKFYRNYIGPGVAGLHGDMSPECPTAFELVRKARMGAVSVLELTARGASSFLPGRALDRDSIANLKRLIWTGRTTGQLPFLNKGTRDEGSGLGFVPRFIMVNLPEVDHIHHRNHTESPEIPRIYDELDAHIGDVAGYLARLGLLDRTYLALISDHGMTDVSKSLSLQDYLAGIGLTPYVPTRSTPYEIGNTNRLFATLNADRFDAFICWGGNADVLLYLKGRDESGKAAWGGTIDEAWLRKFPVKNARQVDLIRTLTAAEGVGLVAWRTASDRFRFATARGSSELRCNDGRNWSYKLLRGADPFGYDAEGILKHLSRFRTENEWLEITAATSCPMAPVNIGHALSHPARSPALAVVAAEGWDFIPAFLKTSIAGSHGGVSREHVVVPFMIRGPGLTPNRIRAARTIDMVPTLLGLIGVPIPEGVVDGRDLQVGR